jgi:DNA ligase-associated metallophosphoesterase
MQAPVLHTVRNQSFWLSPNRSLFWEEEKTLVVSDLHFGKTGHFRKHGIAVPQQVYKEDLQRLFSEIQHFKPERLIAVGDLFHSHENQELDWFCKWKKDLLELDFMLVRGNHDILAAEWYEKAGITLVEKSWHNKGFSFVHDPQEAKDIIAAEDFIFSGHLHPGISIKGIGKQSLCFPCFYFSGNMCILPAFSKFSGLAMVRRKKNDQVYLLIDGKLSLL